MDMLKAGQPEVVPIGIGLVLRGEGKTLMGLDPWARHLSSGTGFHMEKHLVLGLMLGCHCLEILNYF